MFYSTYQESIVWSHIFFSEPVATINKKYLIGISLGIYCRYLFFYFSEVIDFAHGNDIDDFQSCLLDWEAACERL
jgi:hypothetical protein